MLFVLMFVCAAIAVLLVGLGAFTVLRDLWAHPDHRIADQDARIPRFK